MEKASATTTAADSLLAIGENTIYLMGFSFALGSLFTILMLLILDFMRRNADK